MRTLEYITLLHGPPWNLVKKSWKVLFSYRKLLYLCSHGWTTITKISFLSVFSTAWPKILNISQSAILKYHIDDWKYFWGKTTPPPHIPHCQKVRIELVEPSKSVWGFDTFIVDIYWLLVIDIQNKSDWNVKLFF